MRADRRDPIINALRKFKPVRFVATLRDGTTKDLVLSTKQNRWELLSDTINVLPWATIEALDEKGSVLGAVERESDTEEILEDDPIDVAMTGVERFAKILLNVMTTTQTETRKMFADSMKVHADMASSMLESQRVLHESYSLALKVQSAALQGASTGEGGEDGVMKMLQMAMALKMGGAPAITVTPPPPKPKPANPNGKSPA
jgi:hypothetical protein